MICLEQGYIRGRGRPSKRAPTGELRGRERGSGGPGPHAAQQKMRHDLGGLGRRRGSGE